MAELDRPGDRANETVRLGGGERGGVEPEMGGGTADDGERGGGVGGRDQQELLSACRQRADATGERLLRSSRRRAVRPARQLQQRQRIAVRACDDGVAPRGVDPVADQLPRLGIGEAPDTQLDDAGQRERLAGLVADREQQHDPLGLQTARGEAESVRRLVVEPRRVVEQGEQRLLVGGVGEKRKNPHADQEPIGLALVRKPERAAERARLRLREPVDPVLDRPQQLVQRGVRKLSLGLDPGRPQHPEVAGHRRCLLEQGGLADAGLAADDQRPAGPEPGCGEKLSEPCQLGLTTDQHASILTPHWGMDW